MSPLPLGCVVDPAELGGCLERLAGFASRYTPFFIRSEQRAHAVTYIEGLLSDLRRKTIEPIATAHEQPRRPLQRFVGAGAFDDDLLLAELRRHVVEEIGDPAGVLALDPTCFEKKGNDSVGVSRQWNGRLGKTDNCQKSVMLSYAAPGGSTLIDRALYMPRERIRDKQHRARCHVPKWVKFRKVWQLGLELLDRAETVPHAWVVADEEFGRAAEFRDALRRRSERYALDVPRNTAVRPTRMELPQGRSGVRRTHLRAEELAELIKPGAWVRVLTRDGSKGPIYVLATSVEVTTRVKNAFKLTERLVIIKTEDSSPQYWYVLTNASSDVPIGTIVAAWATRHTIEECFGVAKGDSGLAQYEVRSWVGWHHHTTFALLAAWFLVLERKVIAKKKRQHSRSLRRHEPSGSY